MNRREQDTALQLAILHSAASRIQPAYSD